MSKREQFTAPFDLSHMGTSRLDIYDNNGKVVDIQLLCDDEIHFLYEVAVRSAQTAYYEQLELIRHALRYRKATSSVWIELCTREQQLITEEEFYWRHAMQIRDELLRRKLISEEEIHI